MFVKTMTKSPNFSIERLFGKKLASQKKNGHEQTIPSKRENTYMCTHTDTQRDMRSDKMVLIHIKHASIHICIFHM